MVSLPFVLALLGLAGLLVCWRWQPDWLTPMALLAVVLPLLSTAVLYPQLPIVTNTFLVSPERWGLGLLVWLWLGVVFWHEPSHPRLFVWGVLAGTGAVAGVWAGSIMGLAISWLVLCAGVIGLMGARRGAWVLLPAGLLFVAGEFPPAWQLAILFLLLGIFPLDQWRHERDWHPLAWLLPLVVSGTLLWEEATTLAEPSTQLFFLIWALLSGAVAMWQMWLHARDVHQFFPAWVLWLVSSGAIVLLVVPESYALYLRGMIAGLAGFFFLFPLYRRQDRWLTIALLLILLGTPFTGMGASYSLLLAELWEQAPWLLLVWCVWQVLGGTAVAFFVFSHTRSSYPDLPNRLHLLAVLVLGAASLSTTFVLTATSALLVLVIGLSLIAGYALLDTFPRLPHWSSASAVKLWRGVWDGARTAVLQAGEQLQGTYGLVWLLVFLIIFLVS